MKQAHLSRVGQSNLFTMKAAGQVPAESYEIPDEATRRLRANLILEEALETIDGLGFMVVQTSGKIHVVPGPSEPDLEKIVDGCCDTIYVAVGTMIACGVPDLPHLMEVCRANDAKFPGGKAILREDGKFLKPEGWVPPNHALVRDDVARGACQESDRERAWRFKLMARNIANLAASPNGCHRVSGQVVCEKCGLPYFDHPSKDGLVLACDGSGKHL